MARQKRDGLLYFPFDTDFFYADTKIRALQARYGSDGLMFYIFLLTEIYRETDIISYGMQTVKTALWRAWDCPRVQ